MSALEKRHEAVSQAAMNDLGPEVRLALNRRHVSDGTALPLCANGLNRSRGRALRHGRASNGWNDESVLPDDDEGPEA